MEFGQEGGCSMHRGLEPSPESFEASGFFDVLLPSILRDLGSATYTVDGVVVFDVAEGTRISTWHIDFRNAMPSVAKGDHPQPDVSILMDASVLLPILLGRLEVDSAIERGDIDVDGSPEVLERLSQLLGGSIRGIEAQYLRVPAKDPEDRGDES